jgi:two-component system cell cycle response regulator
MKRALRTKLVGGLLAGAGLAAAYAQMAEELETRKQELEAERERLREAFARMGDALGATHDRDQLLRVVLETALVATGAIRGELECLQTGARLEAGGAVDGPDRIELPVSAGRTEFARLVLTGRFDDDARFAAVSLAGQAAVALENARLHEAVEGQARIDPLTGLPNRRRCEEALAVEVARAQRFDAGLAVVVADLDDFKGINDRHGHAVGDDVLRVFAVVLATCLRETDLAGRWGGEEFVLLLPGTDAEGARLLADRIRERLERRAVPVGDKLRLRLTASFGVAAASGALASEDLLAAADDALYVAKRTGKNRVEVAPPAALVRKSA